VQLGVVAGSFLDVVNLSVERVVDLFSMRQICDRHKKQRTDQFSLP
jgi:hypothetical protein